MEGFLQYAGNNESQINWSEMVKESSSVGHQPDRRGDGFGTVPQVSQTGGFSAAAIQTKQHLLLTAEEISLMVGNPRGLDDV